MPSSRMRTVGLTLFSGFIVWHLIGITIVGPLINSRSPSMLSPWYKDYLSLFHLDRAWPFYAPNPQLGTRMRYQVVDATGQSFTYPLTEARSRYSHAFARYSNVFVYLFQYPQYSKERRFDKSVARYLCARHIDENIISINLIVLTQKPFSPDDYRAGKDPLAKEFVDQQIYGPYPCSSEKLEASSG